ncbi:hypothetical protein SAMN06265222_11788 [Neorhodopirellula lusitana]|uniref:Uncharacterized protein n=1 Tax=Neorhodopirellula lusitana TaxID=445327 RepID=A0ABY1QPF7_9BACT|nr:hypothetical protein [Neorhodopirellula lusitana]SMP74251.1 hypothetical protein SAMN06265222_11788 [Neorhodopirellula lusitana]
MMDVVHYSTSGRFETGFFYRVAFETLAESDWAFWTDDDEGWLFYETPPRGKVVVTDEEIQSNYMDCGHYWLQTKGTFTVTEPAPILSDGLDWIFTKRVIDLFKHCDLNNFVTREVALEGLETEPGGIVSFPSPRRPLGVPLVFGRSESPIKCPVCNESMTCESCGRIHIKCQVCGHGRITPVRTGSILEKLPWKPEEVPAKYGDSTVETSLWNGQDFFEINRVRCGGLIVSYRVLDIIRRLNISPFCAEPVKCRVDGIDIHKRELLERARTPINLTSAKKVWLESE